MMLLRVHKRSASSVARLVTAHPGDDRSLRAWLGQNPAAHVCKRTMDRTLQSYAAPHVHDTYLSHFFRSAAFSARRRAMAA